MSVEGTVLIAFILVSICFIAYQVAKGEWFETVPRIMWFCFMTLPFAVQ